MAAIHPAQSVFWSPGCPGCACSSDNKLQMGASQWDNLYSAAAATTCIRQVWAVQLNRTSEWILNCFFFNSSPCLIFSWCTSPGATDASIYTSFIFDQMTALHERSRGQRFYNSPSGPMAVWTTFQSKPSSSWESTSWWKASSPRLYSILYRLLW